jgi:hypothetical protein
MNSHVFLVPGNMGLSSAGYSVCWLMVIAICNALKTWRDLSPAVSLVGIQNHMAAQPKNCC